MNNINLGRSVEKVKVTRVHNLFVIPTPSYMLREKVIKDYVYSPQVRIIA